MPYVFTEQGISMLSSVLKSKRAINISIEIMRAFVKMRRFINNNAFLFHKINSIEKKQIEDKIITDKKFEEIFKTLESKETEQGIFYDGQVFDAYVFISKLIKKAKKSIILIDNYVDESVLNILNKRQKNCEAIIYTRKITKQLELDLKKYNSQYKEIKINIFKDSHDRFLIIDDNDVYHIGGSLKDLGKKWVAFSKFDKESLSKDIVKRLK